MYLINHATDMYDFCNTRDDWQLLCTYEGQSERSEQVF